MNNIKMIPVKSSNVASIGYDIGTRVLRVIFKYGGIYEYNNVSIALFNKFLSAPSKGKFVNQFLREKFPSKKIN